jgi:hypothetical protein
VIEYALEQLQQLGPVPSDGSSGAAAAAAALALSWTVMNLRQRNYSIEPSVMVAKPTDTQ